MKITIEKESQEFGALMKHLQHTSLIPQGFECQEVILCLCPVSQVEDALSDAPKPQTGTNKKVPPSVFVANLIADRKSRMEHLLKKQQTSSDSL